MWNGKRLNERESWMATLNTAMRRYSNALVCLMAILTLITTVGCESDESGSGSGVGVGGGGARDVGEVDLIVAKLSAPTTAEAGTSFPVTSTIMNIGKDYADGTRWSSSNDDFYWTNHDNYPRGIRVGIYLSYDPIIKTDDLLLADWHIDRLDGKSATIDTAWITIPSGINPGTYYIGVFVDDQYNQWESEEMNNTLVKKLTITEPAPASATGTITAEAIDQDTETDDLDLTVAQVEEVGPGRYNPGDVIAIESAIENRGSVPAYSFTVALYASSDPDITRADYFLGQYTINALAPGAMDENPTLCALPSSIPDGFYFIGAIVDDGDDLPESDESNNAATASCSIEIVTPASEETL